MKKIVLFALGMAMSMTTFAQDEVETTISADVVSNYIWRGQDLGGVSLQPTLGIAYKGFSLTGWGSVGLTDPTDTKEFDLTAAYTVGGFNIGVTDYWFNAGLDPAGRYFKYDAHGTNHVFEANVGYDFGVASLQWFTNFSGNDGANKDGKRAYSSYVEAIVPFKFASVDWTATAGAVPFATDFYNGWTSGFAVTNLSLKATKDVKVTESFSVPVFAQVAANPCTQKAYLVLGFTLIP
ncbi:hypothetical protein [Prevotella sp. E2-28]|uniref:hypothetical protein n=1 Tax=Prevotella sp. E2-28 TaxID=2913620 RepID=UPI001EDA559F|nr:hypothetical protein [Prevotella sp. E2-28]UKK53152.1 hypothetical protein L6465_11245 [Prevotella sp. E2-28]